MYETQEWSNEYGVSPFTAERMKHIEDGIYENSLDNVYSTEETFTGKYWIDGKKVYRKVIEKTISKANNTYSYSSLGLTNIGTIIKLYGISAGNPIEQDYYAGSEDSLRTFANVNGINVNSGSSYPTMPYTLYIIIEYTKTTE